MSPPRFAAAEAAFAEIHAGDPRRVPGPDGEVPVAVRYHETLARHLARLDSAAPEVVRLAAACQHLRRWALPRTDFPPGKTGYKRWRSTLAARHAREAGEILTAVGYDPATVARVGDLLIKKHLRSDPEVQLLEDAVCLTFLELDYPAFATAHPPDKVVEVLRKTWDKMSERGHAEALALVERLAAAGAPAEALELVHRAVRGDD